MRAEGTQWLGKTSQQFAKIEPEAPIKVKKYKRIAGFQITDRASLSLLHSEQDRKCRISG